MDNLTRKLHKYFCLFESHENQIQEWLKEAAKPLHSIVNQSAIFRAVAPKDSIENSPFKKFEGFRESLYDIILSSLEEELELLESIGSKINAANETLYKEQTSIEDSYHDLREKQLLHTSDLNPCSPRLEHLIDWCYDIWNYYHTLYLQISQALINVKFDSEKSVEVLLQSFKEDPEAKAHIIQIRSFNLSNFQFLNL